MHRLRPSVPYTAPELGCCGNLQVPEGRRSAQLVDLWVTLSRLPSQNFKRKFPWIPTSY